MKFFYLFLSIVFNVLSYVLYKSIAPRQHTMIWYLLLLTGLILGLFNVVFFTISLKNIPLNVAYPVFSGCCIFSIVLISYFVFGEKLSFNNFVGAILVIIGIAFLTV